MRAVPPLLLLVVLALSAPSAQDRAAPASPRLAERAKAGSLDMYFIDTEGGQATLYVSPSGESLLVDTGNPGGRDAGRIMLALADAGAKQIDHLVLTHYHSDHIGSVLELAKQIPIKRLYDHGPNVQSNDPIPGFRQGYEELTAKTPRTVLKPGDKVPFAGVDWLIVMSAGQPLTRPVDGGGRPNPACATFKPQTVGPNPDDNGQSVGSLITFGRFRSVNLGDLLWNNEGDLMCPVNPIGTVDLYVVSHHGLDRSGSEALVHGLAPRVALMNNGHRKGGQPQALSVIHRSPGLEDLWQLHWGHHAGIELNAPALFIANVEDNAALASVLTSPPLPPNTSAPPSPEAAAHSPAYWLKVSAMHDGTFTMTNPRNGFSKTYRPRPSAGSGRPERVEGRN
jgi:competence protein ComEC